MSNKPAINVADVLSAADLIRGVAVPTPLLEYLPLNQVAGGRVLVKFEGPQHTGSFKFRGAYNRLARIPKDARPAGVVAFAFRHPTPGGGGAAEIVLVIPPQIVPRGAPPPQKKKNPAPGGPPGACN